MRASSLLLSCLGLAALCAAGGPAPAAEPPPPRKVSDSVVYQDPQFYAAFPSVVTLPSGEMVLAFRRAPERRALGEGGTSHTDPNSYLVQVRSKDGGQTWTREPELIYAHPFGGSQDPCLYRMKNGRILCASYGWARLSPDAAAKKTLAAKHGDFVFMGGYLLYSDDDARTWHGPLIPPPTPRDQVKGLFDEPCPAYNRGAMTEGRDGRLYWAVARSDSISPSRTSVHLITSADRGESWKYESPIAEHASASFNETSVIETAAGDLVAFLRTEGMDDHTVIARSKNGGKSFEPYEDTGFQGHPHFALPLPDGRIFLVYGYRHRPFGIRARILDAECANAASAPEIVLRDDGGHGDLGYPWAALTPEGEILVVYYFNIADGPRHIAATRLALK